MATQSETSTQPMKGKGGDKETEGQKNFKAAKEANPATARHVPQRGNIDLESLIYIPDPKYAKRGKCANQFALLCKYNRKQVKSFFEAAQRATQDRPNDFQQGAWWRAEIRYNMDNGHTMLFKNMDLLNKQAERDKKDDERKAAAKAKADAKEPKKPAKAAKKKAQASKPKTTEQQTEESGTTQAEKESAPAPEPQTTEQQNEFLPPSAA